MLCKCHWIVLYTVHFTAFCLGGPFFPGHGVCAERTVVGTLQIKSNCGGLLVLYNSAGSSRLCHDCWPPLKGRLLS